MMTIHEFTEEIKAKLNQYLPEELSHIECTTRMVTKNNNTMQVGIELKDPNKDLAPIIYMEDYYQEYRSGREMESIVPQVAELYQTLGPEDQFLEERDPQEYHSVKDRITVRLVNAKANLQDLAMVPHRKIEDLAMIYQVALSDIHDQGHASIKVTNALMELWGVDEATLHEAAMENTKELFPPSFSGMSSILQEMIPEGAFSDAGSFITAEEDIMYVLSNAGKINGAAMILYPEVLDGVSKALQEDYYILPSSIHEVIIVPKSKAMSPKELGEMVREINRTEVSKDEILSDRIYEYDKEAKTFHQVKESMERSKGMER